MQNQTKYIGLGALLRGAVPFAVALSAGLSSGVAHAQGPLPPGSFVIGGERLMGIAGETLTTEASEGGASQETTLDSTSIALLGQGGLSLSGFGAATLPRFGFDGVLGPGVTLGGSLFYTRSSGETETETSSAGVSMTEKDDAPTLSWFVIHPRVGYALGLSDQIALWPRAGITYSRIGIENEGQGFVDGAIVDVKTETTVTMTDFSLEVLLAASPVPNTAIVFGPFLELPLGGGSETDQEPSDPTDTNPDQDVSYTAYGLVVGLALVL